jgi:DNA-binding NtrC family response regulator
MRALQNLMERAVVVSPGPVLRWDGARLPIGTVESTATTLDGTDEAPRQPRRDRDRARPWASAEPGEALTLAAVEKRHLLTVLHQTGGGFDGPHGAAKVFNLHPNTLRSRMQTLQSTRADHDRSSALPALRLSFTHAMSWGWAPYGMPLLVTPVLKRTEECCGVPRCSAQELL